MRNIALILCLSGSALASPTEAATGPSLIETSAVSPRELGLRRQRRAGRGLMIAGAALMLVVPLLWAIAVPASNAADSHSDAPFVMAGLAGYGSLAFGMVGGQLLTIGGILYKDAGDGERHMAAAPTGVAVRF